MSAGPITIRVVDFETTALELPQAAVVEVATVDLVGTPQEGGAWTWKRERMWSSLVNPGVPIPPEASAVHHITDADVAAAPAWVGVVDKLMVPTEYALGPDFFAAANAKFEQQFASVGDIPWICSYRVGVTLWPEAPNHKNQTLRYFLKMRLDPALANPPHRAGPDAYVTAAILRAALTRFIVTPDELAEISAKPVVLPRLHFGKHAGVPIAEVPGDYLAWVLKQTDMDEDAKHTAAVVLAERRQATRGRSGPVDPGRVAAAQQKAESR